MNHGCQLIILVQIKQEEGRCGARTCRTDNLCDIVTTGRFCRRVTWARLQIFNPNRENFNCQMVKVARLCNIFTKTFLGRTQKHLIALNSSNFSILDLWFDILHVALWHEVISQIVSD